MVARKSSPIIKSSLQTVCAGETPTSSVAKATALYSQCYGNWPTTIGGPFLLAHTSPIACPLPYKDYQSDEANCKTDPEKIAQNRHHGSHPTPLPRCTSSPTKGIRNSGWAAAQADRAWSLDPQRP